MLVEPEPRPPCGEPTAAYTPCKVTVRPATNPSPPTTSSSTPAGTGESLVIAIASAVLTPSPDPYSMMLMCGPLVLLYFGGILLCKYLPSRRSAFAEEEPATA